MAAQVIKELKTDTALGADLRKVRTLKRLQDRALAKLAEVSIAYYDQRNNAHGQAK